MTKHIQRPTTPKPRIDRKIGLRKAQTAAASQTVRQTKKPAAPKPVVPKPKVSSKKHIEEERVREEAAADRAREDALQDDLEDAQHAAHLARHVHLEAEEELEELEREEKLHDTAATGDDAVKRSQGESSGGDGFGGRDRGREAYERWLRGNVSADAARFDELRRRGARDDFDPDRAPPDVEALGAQRASAHVVRLYEMWTLAGVTRDEAIGKAAHFLAGFAGVQNIRRVLAELESKPIRDVYPLEVLIELLRVRPEVLPGVRSGTVVGRAPGPVIAGVPFVVDVGKDVRVKAFALLGGGRPGYEFHPHKDEGKYTLLIDTPGTWTMAVLAAPLSDLGRIKRESNEAILELFTVDVGAMGKKGEPLTAQEWRAMEEAQRDDDDDVYDEAYDDDVVDGARAADREDARAPTLPVQVRRALAHVRRDDDAPGAATYSWDASFHAPGAPLSREPILHVVVERAGPFDPAWVKAREAIAQKQREHEPGRAVVTADDFTAALRAARVR